MSEQRTVDGVPVKVGDTVWHVHACGVRHRRIAKLDLGSWWPMISRKIYSTEQAALDAAISAEQRAIKQAHQRVRRATKAIERLKARRSS